MIANLISRSVLPNPAGFPSKRQSFSESLEASVAHSGPMEILPEPENVPHPLPAFHPGRVAVLFAARKLKTGGVDADDPLRPFLKFTPGNSPCPLATWKTLASREAVAYHHRNAQVLEKYLQGGGEYYQDITWLNHGRKVGEVPMTVFDTETTGLGDGDRIIQLAASQVDEDLTVRHLVDFNTYINPGVNGDGTPIEIQPGASKVHGIYAEHLKDKPTIDGLLHDFRNALLKRNGLGVAYNAKFDTQFLNRAIEDCNRSPLRKQKGYLRPLEPALILDPFVLIQRIHPYVSVRKRLEDHYGILMGGPLENKHDAQADVDATVDVLKYALHYLEKHSIPLEWAKAVEARLPQREWEPGEKSAVIARLVRKNREALAKRYPVQTEPLKVTDVLKFQHGSPVLHDGTDLPMLDINLNHFGWDGDKAWDGSDTLDPEVTRIIRKQRDTENRLYVVAKFRNEFLSPSVLTVASQVRAILRPGSAPADAVRRDARYRNEILTPMGEWVAEKILTRTLPNDEAGWAVFEASAERKLREILESRLKGKEVPLAESEKLNARLKTLSADIAKHAKTLRQELGDRYFYTEVPVDKEQPLIDPTVPRMVNNK